MKVSRLHRAFPWLTVVLLAILFGLPVLTFAAWFAWELHPLEGYYLTAYRQASKSAKDTGSTTRFRWLMKSSPGRASRVAMPSDVATGWTGNLSIHLSSSAVADGWVSLSKSAPDRLSSAELEGLLRTCIYHNYTYANLVTLPSLEGCTVVLLAVFYMAFLMRGELWQEWRRLWQQVARQFSSPDQGWDSLLATEQVDRQLLRRISPRKLLEKVRAKLAALHAPERNRPGKEKGDFAGSSIKEEPREFAGDEHLNQGTSLLLESPHASSVKKPVPSLSIFPGARAENGTSQEPVVWDESQWID